MREPKVRIVLDLDGDSNTWVTVMPVNALSAEGIWRAVDDAASMFKFSVARDADVLAGRLRDAYYYAR